MSEAIPPAVQQAWSEGRQIDAIKQLRALRPGLSLKEAKDLLEGRSMATPAWQPGQPLPEDVRMALQDQQPIEAIRRLRAATGLGLKEAKELVDAAQAASAPHPGSLAGPGEQPASRWASPRVLFLLLGLGLLGWWLWPLSS